MFKRLSLISVIATIVSVQPASAQRFTPVGLCSITNDSEYESLTLPIGIGSVYPSGSVQSISVIVGDTEDFGGNVATDGDDEYVRILIDSNNNGTPESLASDFCDFDANASPVGCTVTQNITIPAVTEDTTFRGRVMLSYGDGNPSNGCGGNSFGDSEDFLVVADVQEYITLSDVSQPEDGGPITVTATLSHNVRDAGGFVSFNVDYVTADGTATTADSDYTSTSGTLTFTGEAGNQQTFTVNPTADILPEGDQTILVSLLNLTDSTYGIDISDTATITLTDDDEEVSLTIAKSVDDNSPSIGSTVVFTLEVSNGGPDAAVGAYVQDTLPDGFSSVTLVSAPAGSSFSIAGNDINWTGIDVPNGGSVSATFSAVVLAP